MHPSFRIKFYSVVLTVLITVSILIKRMTSGVSFEPEIMGFCRVSMIIDNRISTNHMKSALSSQWNIQVRYVGICVVHKINRQIFCLQSSSGLAQIRVIFVDAALIGKYKIDPAIIIDPDALF